jgi:hypothetical protein
LVWLLIEIVLAIYLLGVLLSLIAGSIAIYMELEDRSFGRFIDEWFYRVPRALPQILGWPARYASFFSQFFRRH